MAASFQGKILARSPFYITASKTAGYITSASLEVYIWAGAFASQPGSPTYTIDKNALTGTSTDIIFEISKLIRDSFDHERDAYDDTLSTFTDALWVEIILSVVQTVSSQSDTNNYWLALDGWGEFTDAVNPQGTDVIVNTMYVQTGEDILHPVYSHSDGIDEVKYYSEAGALQDTIDLTTPEASTNAYDKTQYLTRASAENTYSFTLLDGSAVQETVTIVYNPQCKYPAYHVKFYDANGMLQKIYMLKKSTESLSVKKDKYNKILGSVSGGSYSYDITGHQFKTYNVTGQESITLNSDWVNENQNEVFKQLLLSELVWVNDKPATVTTGNLTYKTQVNDRLIQYTIEFEYSYNVINNVY